MNITFWIIQSLVALIFLYSGINKSIYSAQRLVAAGQTGVAGLPSAEIKFIGIIEVLGSFGLIIPQLLHILPRITSITAIGFAVTMTGRRLKMSSRTASCSPFVSWLPGTGFNGLVGIYLRQLCFT